MVKVFQPEYHILKKAFEEKLNIDITSGSYVNRSTQRTIYSFFPNISPGYKIIENPHNLLYLPITSGTIHSITVWPTDQGGNELNLRGAICQCNFIRERFYKYLELNKIQKLIGNGWYLKKGGNVCQIETDGSGLYLGPTSGRRFETVGMVFT